MIVGSGCKAEEKIPAAENCINYASFCYHLFIHKIFAREENSKLQLKTGQFP